MIDLNIGSAFEVFIKWLKNNFEGFFDLIKYVLGLCIESGEYILLILPSFVVIAIMALIAWRIAGRGVAIFTVVGLFLIDGMDLWTETMETTALVLVSALVALIIGIPLGILGSKNKTMNDILRPILDFMQTLPAFVYLIPAVLFFGLGKVPGSVATVIFSMPPVVRLTNLAIRQVPEEVVEAAIAFGSTPRQMLFKVQLPIALPTILAGVNQTIMLALSMVVIAGMIGGGGLGTEVLKGIQQYKIDLGFESGVSVVILAMILDRITQSIRVLK